MSAARKGEAGRVVQDEWTSIYSQAEARVNTPSGMVSLPALTVMRLVTALRKASERAEEATLRSIEASNPGIDMDEVRRTRSGHSGTGAS